MARTSVKCYWCKETVPIEEAFTNDTGKTKQKGHEECYVKAQEKKEQRERNAKFYYKLEDKLKEIFKYPELPGTVRKNINYLVKNGYEYDVILYALKLGEKGIYKNLDKGWPYHFAIIQNNLNAAMNAKKKWQIEQSQKKFKKENKPEKEIIIKKKQEKTISPVKDKFDIANL